MAISKAQQKATAKYKKENYSEIKLLISPKEKKELIKQAAQNKGMSLNAYVNEAIDEKMQKEKAAD